jgi:hypothetical protein
MRRKDKVSDAKLKGIHGLGEAEICDRSVIGLILLFAFHQLPITLFNRSGLNFRDTSGLSERAAI